MPAVFHPIVKCMRESGTKQIEGDLYFTVNADISTLDDNVKDWQARIMDPYGVLEKIRRAKSGSPERKQ